MKRNLVALAGACLAVLVAACGASTSTSTSTSTPGTSATTVAADGARQLAFEADHFADHALVGDVSTVACTLSGGTQTTCAQVTVAGYPASYEVGPFCPRTITASAADAGIWFDGSGVYDLDGAFIKNLAEFYSDSAWQLFDSNGNVNVTDTQEAFEGAARPDVDAKYQNHCVEGRLAWLANGEPIQTTVLIPLQPAKASAPSSSHPGNFGITLDGVVIAESAPVDAILGAHTIAAFDDCGGHYNPAAGYHLHGVTGCGHLEGDAAAGETQMFGYAIDGYPIHLPLAAEASAAGNLDACNGHTTAGEGYHYHANGAAKNAILPCLMGEYVVSSDAGRPPQGPPGGQNGAGRTRAGRDLQAVAATLGVTVHELEDAMAAGDINSAAAILGTTPAAIAKALGVSVADLQAALAAQVAGTGSVTSTGTAGD